ncbi:MAG: hypothetical protein ABIH49_01000 [archaeon]
MANEKYDVFRYDGSNVLIVGRGMSYEQAAELTDNLRGQEVGFRISQLSNIEKDLGDKK